MRRYTVKKVGYQWYIVCLHETDKPPRQVTGVNHKVTAERIRREMQEQWGRPRHA